MTVTVHVNQLTPEAAPPGLPESLAVAHDILSRAEPLRSDPACQQEQEFQAGRIAPMQVFDDDHQGLATCQVYQCLSKGLEQAPLLLFGIEIEPLGRGQIRQIKS